MWAEMFALKLNSSLLSWILWLLFWIRYLPSCDANSLSACGTKIPLLTLFCCEGKYHRKSLNGSQLTDSGVDGWSLFPAKNYCLVLSEYWMFIGNGSLCIIHIHLCSHCSSCIFTEARCFCSRTCLSRLYLWLDYIIWEKQITKQTNKLIVSIKFKRQSLKTFVAKLAMRENCERLNYKM